LVLPCPKDYKLFDSQPPTFTKDNIPKEKDEFNRIKQCGIELPFTAFFQPTHVSSLNRISDPFCRLEKEIAWYIEKKHSNNTGGTIDDKKEIRRGISKEKSVAMSQSAGVEITSSFGIKPLGMGVDVSLNYQFSYSTSSSYGEYEDTVERLAYTVPPYTCTFFLTQRVWLRAVRPDGSYVTYVIEYNANTGLILEEVKLR